MFGMLWTAQQPSTTQYTTGLCSDEQEPVSQSVSVRE